MNKLITVKKAEIVRTSGFLERVKTGLHKGSRNQPDHGGLRPQTTGGENRHTPTLLLKASGVSLKPTFAIQGQSMPAYQTAVSQANDNLTYSSSQFTPGRFKNHSSKIIENYTIGNNQSMNFRTAIDVHSSLDKNRLSTVEKAEPANFSTLEIKERAKTARKKEDWGVQGYYCPTNNWLFHRTKTFMSKTKKENIIVVEAKNKQDLPGPNMYSSIPDWSKNSKGKFPKS